MTIETVEDVVAAVRKKEAKHQPEYEHETLLDNAANTINGYSALISFERLQSLKTQLADVARGNGFVLHGGPCVQTLADDDAMMERLNQTLHQCADNIGEITGQHVVTIGRIGNYAKPRSKPEETVDGLVMPTYRGDSVNGHMADAMRRQPDPYRMVQSYHHMALMTVKNDTLPHNSHEALLLPYELNMLEKDEESGKIYDGSGHFLWIGNRTRQVDGAHIELASHLDNPIGIKIDAATSPDDLKALLDKVDPENEPGKVTLIFRMGVQKIDAHLGPLLDAIDFDWHTPVLMSDPMHGNTIAHGTRKTRDVSHVIAEFNAFAKICTGRGLHPGGIHLEMTGEPDTTECIGFGVTKKDLEKNYQSKCDPNLNAHQALEVVDSVTRNNFLLPEKKIVQALRPAI